MEKKAKTTFVIYGEEKKDEKICRLQLLQEGGKTYVRVVDADGSCACGGYFIEIRTDGIRRCAGFGRDLGIECDKAGKVVVIDD